MKIVWFHQYFATREMSGITRTYEFTRRLAAMGHEIHVITTWHRGGRSPGWHTTDEDGVTVHWLTLDYDNKMGFLRRLISFFSFALRSPIKGMRVSKGADLVYASSGPLTIVIPGMIVSALRRIPMVLEVRDIWPDTAIALGALKNRLAIAAASLLERVAYRRSTHIVAASVGMKETIVRRGIEENRISVIPNSSDLDMFGAVATDNDGLPPEFPDLRSRKLVLYAGTLGRANDVRYLVDIAAQSAMRKREICYLAIGRGMDEAEVRAHAVEVGVLDRNFFMMRPVAKRQMPAMLSRCDLSVTFLQDLPELWASSPNKFFDALAAGRPVAINYGGWKKDIIEAERIGLVLPSDDAPAAESAIHDLLSDEDELRATGKRARKVAEREFDRDQLARRLEAIVALAAQNA